MGQKTLIGAVVVALIVGAAAGFYYGMAQGKRKGIDEGKQQAITELQEKAKKEAAEAVNPFSGTGATVNPFEEAANPLEKVKTNPFE